jgi:iron complex transport system substrate-binding protein
MGRVRLPLLAAAALLLAAGTACGERAEPTGKLVRVYPVTVHGVGDRPTAVSSAPRRIVPVGPGPRQILKALGLEQRTITVNDTLVGLPLVGQLRRAKPDLIVASSDTDPLDLARASTATHSAVYIEPSASLSDLVGGISDIGLLTGRPLQARRLTGAIEAKRRAVAAKVGDESVVTVFVDTGAFSTILTPSLLGDLVAEARGRSVAGPSPEQGPFPLKRLARLNPDVYLATADSGTTLRQLRSNPATRRLRAVRSSRFAILPAGVGVAGPDAGEELEQIARILHPDAFR